MHAEYGWLRSEFDRAEAERIQRELSASPDSFLSNCQEQTARVTGAVQEVLLASESVFLRCDEARQAWLTELGITIDALPIARSVFRSALSEKELFAICRRLPRLESQTRNMTALCSELLRLQERFREASGNLLAVRARILRGACECAGENHRGALCDLRARLELAEKELTERAREVQGRRDVWGAFCMEELPRFLKELRRAADLANEGRGCDLAALYRIVGEMRHRSEHVF